VTASRGEGTSVPTTIALEAGHKVFLVDHTGGMQIHRTALGDAHAALRRGRSTFAIPSDAPSRRCRTSSAGDSAAPAVSASDRRGGLRSRPRTTSFVTSLPQLAKRAGRGKRSKRAQRHGLVGALGRFT
jgi:hypothetical protein